MSLRKNALIAILIVVLCMMLITQLIGNPTPQTKSGDLAVESVGSDMETTSELTEETVELHAVVFMDQEQYQALSQRNDRFRREHPTIQIRLTNLARLQAYSYYKEIAEAGKSPDIMLLDHMWVNEFAASGYLSHELEKYLQVKSGGADGLLEWNGYSWAVPNESDPYVVMVNPDAFAQGDGNSVPGSLEEWLDYRIKRGAGGIAEGTIYVDPDDPFAFVSLIWAFGGEWERAENGMYNIKAPNNFDLLELLFGSQDDEGKNSRQYPLVQAAAMPKEEKWARFDDGSMPVLVVRLSEVLERNKETDRYSDSLVAGTESGKGLWVSGTSYAVSSVSGHPAEAFEWIKAMLSMGNAQHPAAGRAFPEDPESRGKLELIQIMSKGLFDGSIKPNEWNERLVRQWSAE